MNRWVIFAGLGSLAAAYFAGRYSAPEKIKVETVTVTKEVMVQDESKRVNQVQRVIETVSKDGRPIKTTLIRTRAATNRKTTAQSESLSKERKEIENRRGVVVSALIGLPLTAIARSPVYGAAFHKQFIGPLILGAWAFTDLTVGLSVGFEL